MISILIPTYNYDVYPLVYEIHEQGTLLNIPFEIIVYDDHSPSCESNNEKINTLKWATFQKLPKNIGRSAIRNLLAKNASYEFLCFLDADVEIISKTFLATYIRNFSLDSPIIYGGILYQKEKPIKSKILRWHYGNKREALPANIRERNPHLRFLTLNFMIKKNVFNKVVFNEEIPNLRHEDTLFAIDIRNAGIPIKHIDNPVIHLGIESSEVFFIKSLEAVEALKNLVDKRYIDYRDTSLSEKATLIIKYNLSTIAVKIFRIFKKQLKLNILSKRPSLILFDFYRLGYYLELNENNA